MFNGILWRKKKPTGEKGDLSIVKASLCRETSFDVSDSWVR